MKASRKLLSRARGLRREPTEAENTLWKHLRGRRMMGYKFRRQVVIDPYIVDFVCLETKLIIEADGGQHVDQVKYDAQRTVWLEDLGYRILRFWNHEIQKETQSVMEKIAAALIENPSPSGKRLR